MRIAALAAILFCCGCGAAVAALERPNALDRRVDAIPATTLLAQPATALVDPGRQTAAIRRVHWTLPGWILVQVFEAIALFYLWSSGGAARLRDWLRRRLGSEWRVRFLFGAALALVARTAALPAAFYLYRVERTMDLTEQLTRMWGLFWIGHTLMAMVIAGIIAAIVLWLVDRTHQWYAYTIVAILAVCVGWAYVSPYFTLPGSRVTTPVRGALGNELHAMLARAGLPRVPVLLENVRNASIDGAVVLGLEDSRRVVLTDTLVAGNTRPEVEYVVAYELGHVVHRDPLSIALIEGGIIIIFTALAIVIADRIGFRRDDDPVSRLAIVGALLAVVYLAAVPVRNASLRSYDHAADRYAIALTGNPSAAVRALVRESDQRMEEVCPEFMATLYLNTQPAAGARVAAINHVKNGCP